MAGVEAPCVSNTISSCGGHEKTHTPIVLGGNADVECVRPVGGPTCADGGVIIHEAFCSKGRDGHFVEIKKTVDFFIGRLAGFTARETKEV